MQGAGRCRRPGSRASWWRPDHNHSPRSLPYYGNHAGIPRCDLESINDEFYFAVSPRADDGSGVPVSGNFNLGNGADGDDALGRPKVKVAGGFFPLPQQKRVIKPQVDPGSQDFQWSPVGPTDPGVDYDARGRRGFLEERGLYGLPKLDEFGQPVYRLWRNSLGETVEDVPGSQPYELDYIQPEADVRMVSLPTAVRWTGTADFDGDGVAEIIEYDLNSGSYSVLYVDEIGLPRLTRWLRRQFGDENLPVAGLSLDPDFDGSSTLIEYALGVHDVYRERPETVRLEADAGGIIVARFPWRIGDGTLLADIEYLDENGSWAVADAWLVGLDWLSADTAELLVRTGLPAGPGPVLIRLRVETE